MLGIDTGGTFTDAVLVNEISREVVASAKAPTTHHKLIVGVDQAIGSVLEKAGCSPGQIVLVSISTTLATNALVESTGDPACLIAVGFSDAELAGAKVPDALGPDDSLIVVDGGHDAHGNERAPTQDVVAAVVAAIDEQSADYRGYAVASQFSVRNPGHELAVQAEVRRRTGASVTCSHLLSAKLGGPRRALTAFLNARLIGMIAALIEAVHASTDERDIEAPVMVVRGDGSLVSAAFAAARPIETVLSGPAASVIGSMHLGDNHTALVSDIGGTTTDVAIVVDGRPRRTEQGAVVAGHRTMVEAVDMLTVGLGGDSEVRFDVRTAAHRFELGPRRAIPLSRLAQEFPEAVHRFLDRSLNSTTLSSSDTRMLVGTGIGAARPTDDRERAVLDALADGPVGERIVAANSMKARAVDRLRSRGLVRVATMTPTDAAVVLGLMAPGALDSDVATSIATLSARQQDSGGASIAPDAATFSTLVIERLTTRSAEAVLSAGFRADGIDTDPVQDQLVQTMLRRRTGSDPSRQLTQVNVGLGLPVIALGASAGSYYPAVGSMLDCEVVVPAHAEVANAVGAAVGDVVIRTQLTVTQPRKGQFRVHHDAQPTFATIEQAQDHARSVLTSEIEAAAHHAGAEDPTVTQHWDETIAMIDGKRVFVEGTMQLEATARPRTATDGSGVSVGLNSAN